jgi:flagellar export protein FliJ
MAEGNRWRRMSQLVDIDLDAMVAQLRIFEEELDSAKAQLEYLSDFHSQSEQTLSQPMEYGSVQDIQRQIVFIESLQSAMSQQEVLIQKRHQHVDKIRQQVLELYKKKESYLFIAKETEAEKILKDDRAEDHFLDELAQRRDAGSC